MLKETVQHWLGRIDRKNQHRNFWSNSHGVSWKIFVNFLEKISVKIFGRLLRVITGEIGGKVSGKFSR